MNITDIKKLTKASGSHFFDRDTMKYWNSKIVSPIIGDNYFITSEDNFNRDKTLYTIRQYVDGNIITVGDFQQYKSLQDAQNAFKSNIRGTK